MHKLNIRTILILLMIAAAVVGLVLGIMLLPDTLVTQITLDGSAGNTMPKAVGLALPLLLTLAGAWIHFRNMKGQESKNKGVLLALVGIVAMILVFVFNL
ncbi:MAG TPA: hypothetical protein DD640_10515 [Clostridiales bacterium]|nr:hypothetical protein [Clostridiales bacterium]